MKKRSYQQFCPLAYGLDIIGERWTLLLVRELGLGARRFTDLQRGLPTMGSNLLSHRLKSLEEAGVVQVVPLPPPARVMAYQLTKNGWALAAAMQPLVQWGIQFMPNTIPEDDFLGAIPVMLALQVMYQPELAAGEELVAEIKLTPDVFRVTLQGAQIVIEQGYAPQAPLALETVPKAILHVIHGGYPLSVPSAELAISIERGDTALINRFFGQFAVPKPD